MARYLWCNSTNNPLESAQSEIKKYKNKSSLPLDKRKKEYRKYYQSPVRITHIDTPGTIK